MEEINVLTEREERITKPLQRKGWPSDRILRYQAKHVSKKGHGFSLRLENKSHKSRVISRSAKLMHRRLMLHQYFLIPAYI
jgi:hypothetical protein